jgi:preprotein translocase subunit YajC
MVYAVLMSLVLAQAPLFADAQQEGGGQPAAPAQGGGQQGGQPQDQGPFGGLGGMLLPILIVVFIGYFLLFRPAQRQEAERKKLIASLKKGDDVLTNAGIYGQIVSVSETEDEVVVKVDEGTRLKMMKSCIIRNLSGEKALKEQQGTK